MDERNPMMEAAEKCIEALDAVDRAGAAIQEIRPTARLRIELDDPCPRCNDLGTVPNEDDSSFNVRMPCPECYDPDEALDAVDINDMERRIEWLKALAEPEDDRRIHRRFPLYVQHHLAHAIARATHNRGLIELDSYSDAELATFADSYAPSNVSTLHDRRTRSYLHVLAVALRHFQDDPAAVLASIELVHFVAQSGKAKR